MIKIVGLFSGGASAIQYLVQNDPSYRFRYKFIAGISSKKDTKGERFCNEKGISFEHCNTKQFCVKHGYHGKLSDMPLELRTAYYTQLLQVITPYQPDIVLLSGFMLKITKPLLKFWPTINVHPADLRILGADNKPKYTGDDAVTLAIRAGEKSTASTIHMVEEEVDCGRIICVSKPLLVPNGVDPKEHQNAMKTACDGPAYMKAMELIVTGAFSF